MKKQTPRVKRATVLRTLFILNTHPIKRLSKAGAALVNTISSILEVVFTRAAPAFHNLFMVMRCVFDINTVHKTVDKLTFQAFY